ncbi:MAG: ATP-binding cassette domain-containing protein [Chloroflexi bacterium]|nr:ATP-binding cassette domain-containing protein [Chloroflexota bacterium]
MIEANHLTKYYGDFPAITDVSFAAQKGEILGFLGPNAAGKTTTMRILTGYMPPSSGTASIAGYDVVSQSLEARRHVGYLPETVPLYTDMRVKDYLRFMGTIRGMQTKVIKRRIDEVVQLCHLEEYYVAYISKLSKGFRQRVGIAQAVFHEPDVLVLDEPTIGIDPIQVVETRQLIKGLGGERTILLSSHILPEVSMICQRVIIIHEGEIVAVDTPQSLAEHLEGTERVQLEITGPVSQVVRVLRGIPGVQDVSFTDTGDRHGTYAVISKRGSEMRANLAKAIVEQGWGLLRLEPLSLSLEEIFLRLTTTEEAK